MNINMNLPNKLTVLRILMVPLFVLFMLAPFAQNLAGTIIAFILFVGASFTDMLDGKIARKYDLVTNFGKFMDPLADKLLVTAAMLIFVQWNRMPSWAVMVVLAREFAVSGLRMVAATGGKVMAAGWSGKVKTFATMVGLCVMMVLPYAWIDWTVTIVIVVTTLYSGVEYFVQNWNVIKP